jgi:xylulokinase
VNVLAIDLGTSAVKAILWNSADGVVARSSAPVATAHPQSGFDEQDAEDWWSAVQTAIGELPLDNLLAVSLSSQRETFVCLDGDAQLLRPAILWSDGRAPSPAARFAWLQEHEPDVVGQTRWLAAPKDYVLHRLVGRLVTDTTLASRTDVDPSVLPPIVDPRQVVGQWRGVPVLVGAGDRACEVFAVGASAGAPMVSWGTTANCSFPFAGNDVPRGWRASVHVDGRQLCEAGLSGAGSALAWVADSVSLSVDDLRASAATTPPGANGVIALPWLNGARAPWWRADVEMTFVDTTAATTPGELARAVYEGVAHDLRRALATLPQAAQSLRLAGGGAADPAWQQALSGITGLPFTVSEGGDTAAVGAAMLAWRSVVNEREELRVDAGARHEPDPELVATYAELSKAHDAAAAAVLGSTT